MNQNRPRLYPVYRALLLLFALPLLHCEGPPAEPVAVALALSPDNPRIAQGTGQPFALRATFADGRSKDVSAQVQWAVVDQQGRAVTTAAVLPGPLPGLITVEQPGHYRVRGTVQGRVMETSLEVTAATLSSVAISPVTPSIALGTHQQFALTGKFSDGTTQDVTALAAWSLKSLVGTGVAVIDSTGLATSKAIGKVTVSGRYLTKTSSTTLTITAATVTSLGVSPSSPAIAKGTSLQFGARAVFSDGSVQDVTALAAWSVRDVVGTGVAEIDDSGNALGLAIGQVEVSAEYGGQIASTTMSVTAAAVVGLKVAPASAAIPLGIKQQFTATAALSDGTSQDVTTMAAWTTTDVSGTGVASVDAHGMATGKALGTANITATYSGVSAMSPLVVGPAVLVRFAVSPTTATLNRGSVAKFSALGTYSDGSVQDVSSSSVWTIADITGSGVGSVDAKGIVTAQAVGKAAVTATYVKSTASATVTVVPPTIVSLALSPPSAAIARASTQRFRALATLSDGTTQDVSATAMWTETDLVGAGVASVDATGLATAKADGQASINAAYSGLSATALLSVATFGIMPLPTTQTLWGIWGSSPTNVWAVGVAGTILHYDGTSWTAPTTIGGAATVNSVWGSGPSDVWFGSDAAVIHYNGSSFTATALSASVFDLWGTSASNIWAATTAGAYHYDGVSWTQKYATATSVNCVWGSGPSDVWLLGYVNLHWNGTTMETPTLPPNAGLWAVSGSGASDVWSVGQGGALVHYDGATWTAVPSGTTQWLVGVSSLSPTDMLITGYAGTILRWDGTALSPVSSPTTLNLMRSLRTGGQTFITGFNGTILH